MRKEICIVCGNKTEYQCLLCEKCVKKPIFKKLKAFKNYDYHKTKKLVVKYGNNNN